MVNRKLIQVFEHSLLKIDDEDPKKISHRQWQALSDFTEKSKNKYFEITAKGVIFSKYVGAIQIGNTTIEILPKIYKSISEDENGKTTWHDVLLKILRKCSRLKTESFSDANLRLRKNSILDWYIELLLDEIQTLQHYGLVKKYRKLEGNSNALKGQLLFSEQIKRNINHQEQFFVRYSIFDRDNLYNQILFKSLNLVRKLSINPSILDKLNRVSLDFPEVSDIVITEKLFTDIVYNRKTERYRNAINMAKLLLLNYSPDIRHGQNHIIALLFDMNRLWEDYMTLMLKGACARKENWKLHSQKSHPFWYSKDGTQKKSNKPDILIIPANGEHIVIDAKWKLYEQKGLSEDDLRQVFVYGQYYKAKKVFLLYPSLNHKVIGGSFNAQKYDDDSCWSNLQMSGGLLFINILGENGKDLNPLIGEVIIRLIEKEQNGHNNEN